MPRTVGLVLALGLGLVARAAPAAAALPDEDVLRSWIREMKASPKGPFQRIRWFCADGTVQPPRAFACAEHGGGVQHGEWTERAERLRDGGYLVGNVLAGLEGERFAGEDPDLGALKQILLERFLIRADDGWIFRGAFSYRGALQVEDEEAGSLRVLEAMLRDPAWRTPMRFFLLREAARLLPRPLEAGKAQQVRELAVEVANADPGFASLRAKIHNAPEATDAVRVREYAQRRGKPATGELYEKLAHAIDQLYLQRAAVAQLLALADRAEAQGESSAAALLREDADRLSTAADAAERYDLAARLLAEYRTRLSAGTSAPRSLLLLDASLATEDEVFAAANAVAAELPGMTRRQRLDLLDSGAAALYGVGLIGERQLRGLESTLSGMQADRDLDVDQYRRDLQYLSRAPEWAGRWVEFTFGDVVQRWTTLEPLAPLYPQDRLRGSPLLFYGAVLDGLVNDANDLAGIEHRVFGRTAGAGLRALNPGLARGVLLSADGGGERMRRDGIYLLPETTSELPPVAGILTRGEGSSLSHVQLLARNLGIPNVVVRESLLPTVQSHLGEKVVLAVSPGGVVQIAADGPGWDEVLGASAVPAGGPEDGVVIRPDLQKLDLTVTDFVPLGTLRASDSGRICGPKGANLGELKHHFGDAVPDGFVIPFGVFRQLLDRPIDAEGPSVWEWMKGRYELIAHLGSRPEAQERVVEEFLTALRTWILEADLGEDFEKRFAARLEQSFGPPGSYGVFVRSDTNVEDLAGFTGAGLNKTVANRVGTEGILRAVREVWASPFTERAYSWRQAHMERPEYVFPAVVVQKGFPAEKSGVMVTVDVDTGDPDWLSVAVNEGVGGAVDGQAAESLRVSADGQDVVYLAQATARDRALLAPAGGIERRPTTGTETILEPGEIRQLVKLAHEAPRKFPTLRNDGGPPKPADIEFAFRDGKLALLQLRPFVENKAARGNAYLQAMDAEVGGDAPVDLDAVPRAAAR